MTILLLGGSGLLGHNVLHRLLDQGHAVHALVRNTAAIHLSSSSEGLTLFQGSLLRDEDLFRAAQGCDAVINCAGTTDMSLLHPDDYKPVNSLLCHRLVQLMAQVGITRLVHTSTANTIGFGTPSHPATEESPIQPPFADSFYARSKQEGEMYLLQAARQHPDWHIVILNPGFMVGPFDTKPSSGTLLLTGYRKPLMFAPKGGKSFVHVADVAAAAVNALAMGQHGGRYLLTGENLTLQQFYRLQAQTMHYRQLLIPVPNWLLGIVGRVGDLLRCCGLATQVSTRNVRQLMVREYYDNSRAVSQLTISQTPISQAVSDFFNWWNNRPAKSQQ